MTQKGRGEKEDENEVPQIFVKHLKNQSESKKRSIPKGIENLIDFRIHFPLILAPFGDPSWAHVGHFFATRGPQDPSKKHHKLIPTLKTAQNASWTRPGALQTSILAPLDLHSAPQDFDFGASGA